MIPKPVVFLGDSLERIRKFPDGARNDAGYQLSLVQLGRAPSDFKPLPSVGPGVEEIRVWEQSGSYRVIYVARHREAVYVLHAFQKKTQATPKRELALARQRLALIAKGRQ